MLKSASCLSYAVNSITVVASTVLKMSKTFTCGVCRLTEPDGSGGTRPIYCCRERQTMEGEVMQMQEDMQTLMEADLNARQVH